MRNKLLNNNQPNYISKGGVLYKPGEIPALTKEQLTQASLVSKLPRDFPFANWEGMTTKQQLRTIGYSGLTAQEQWSLLNANVPLAVLNEHNQAQEYAAAQASPVQAPALLSAKAVQALAQNIQKTSTNSLISPSLQSGVPQRKLEEQKENLQTKLLGKTAIAAANPVKITNPTKTPYSYKPLEKGDGSGDTDGEDGKGENVWDQITSWVRGLFTPKEEPKGTPQVVQIATPQIVTITMDTPSPMIPMTPTPSPTLSPSEQRAQAAVKQGMALADEKIKYKFGGKKVEDGLDCSGLVVIELQASGFKFGNGDLSLGAEFMARSFLENKLGKSMYSYTEDTNFPPLHSGDLIFSADKDDLTKNEHVTMATGNKLQVVEASSVAGYVTYQYGAYKTHENGKYFRDSGQVVTQVIRPFY